MSDDSDSALLDRVASGIHRLSGLEKSSEAPAAQFQPSGNAAWVRQQFSADAAMRRDYLQAAVAYPNLFRDDNAIVERNVEAVIRHFAGDGLTRRDYFTVLAAEPLLLRQKPTAIISNIEAVLDRDAADPQMRKEYLQAAALQPVLFRAPPRAVLASIEAAADRLEAQGFSRSDIRGDTVELPVVFSQAPEAIKAPPLAETGLALPTRERDLPSALPNGPSASLSPLPATVVQNPALYVSYVPAPGHMR